MTHYFYHQSDGLFTLYGEAFHEVIETQLDEEDYGITGTGQPSTTGMALLTEEILDHIDQDGFDFSSYDNDGPDGVPDSGDDDGYVDQIFVIIRKLGTVDWSGYSVLGDAANTLEYDSKLVHWEESGSYNRYNRPGNGIPLLTFGQLLAHEFGHKMWKSQQIGGVHLQSIDSNDVPFGPPAGTTVTGRTTHTAPSERIAYAAMPGDGGAGDMAGNQTISAFERHAIGWIDCVPLTSNSTGVSLDNLYTTGDCWSIPLDNSATGDTVFLSNLQRDVYFDRHYLGNWTCPYPFEDGLMSTGLLAGIKSGSGTSTEYDELPADNTEITAIDSTYYHGDLYSPQTSQQLTAWTRPSINGWTDYGNAPPGFVPSWKAVDNIRYGATPDRIYFDYKADFRQSPTVRDSSWMGAETAATTISGTVTLVDGGILTITADLTLPNVTIQSGGELIIDPGVDLTAGVVIHVRDGGSLAHGSRTYVGIAFDAEADTYIYSTSPNSNYGSANSVSAMNPTKLVIRQLVVV